MNQSKELSHFYKSIQRWIDSDYTEYSDIFSKVVGLCSNLYHFAKFEYPYQELDLLNELDNQFSGVCFPFNNDDCSSYKSEYNKYLNPNRLSWIESHIPKD